MFKAISLALATVSLGAALTLAVPAAAQQRDTRTTGVTYADLDLATEEGRAELDRRIDYAARQVCGMSERTIGSNIVTRETRTCFRDAKRQLEQHFAGVIARQSNAG
jgi:UrcA family protein